MFSSRLGPSGCFDESRRRTGSHKNAAKASAETLPLRQLPSSPLHLLRVLASLPARGRGAAQVHGQKLGSVGGDQVLSVAQHLRGKSFLLVSPPLHMSSGPFRTEEKRSGGLALGPRTARLPLPHQVIQMFCSRVRRRRAGQLAGPWGSGRPCTSRCSSCCTHSCCCVFSFFLPHRSSAGAVTPIILLSFAL